MSYDELWNGTLYQAIAMVDGYLKRQEDSMRGLRRLAWFSIMPWVDKHERGLEFDMWHIPGDPTPEELEVMKETEAQREYEKLKAFRDQVMQQVREEENKAKEFLKNKMQ